MPKFYVESVGCDRRDLDAQKVADYLVANGYEMTLQCEEAEIIILGTCGVTQARESRCIRLVEDARLLKSESARVVVIGCLGATNPKVAEDFPDVNFLSPTQLGDIDRILGLPISFEDFEDSHVVGAQISERNGRPGRSTSDRYLVWTSHGCPYQCSHCAARLSIGPVQSRPLDVIVAEIQEGIDKGYTKIALTGDNMGAYGMDTGSSSWELFERVFAIPGDFKILVNSAHPAPFIRERLGDLLAKHADKIARWTMPIESGCNRILKLMRRHYTTEALAPELAKITSLFPVGTGVIVGYPTETEEDFEETCRFMEGRGFVGVRVNLYSDRKGTPAYEFTPKVPEEVIIRRAKTLERITNVTNLGWLPLIDD